MLTLPIKAGWYHMILHGYKKEEYRDIKQYYTIKFKKLFRCESLSQEEFVSLIEENNDGKFTSDIILRNGFSSDSPSAQVNITLTAGEGNPDWGAEKGVRYYILTINDIKELVKAKTTDCQEP